MKIEQMELKEGVITTDQLTEIVQKGRQTEKYWIIAEDLKIAYDFAVANGGKCVMQLKGDNIGTWIQVRKEWDDKPIDICEEHETYKWQLV